MRNKIVEVAVSQLGTAESLGDDRYIQWYNEKTGEKFPLNVAWCQIFVAWCAAQAGISENVIPVTASCTMTMNWFKENRTWHEVQDFKPEKGDLVFFDWDGSGDCDHVGIVREVGEDWLTDIEGNASGSGTDAVREKRYARADSRIRGYARPDYRSMPSDWAKEATEWAVAEGLFRGDEKGDMDWQGTVTREALAVVLHRWIQDR